MIVQPTVALFGEASRGHYHELLAVNSIDNLYHLLGDPPEGSKGIPTAISILLNKCKLVYVRVLEEGFSHESYYIGMRKLRASDHTLNAVVMPKVGDEQLIEEACALCHSKQCIFLIEEQDAFDYMLMVQSKNSL